MQDISLHLLDIIENSIRAKAQNVEIYIEVNKKNNMLKIKVDDDGHGMDEDMLVNSQNPFFTTKIDREKKIGLGIPLFKQNAEACDGSFLIRSKKGKGTTIAAEFRLNHIDRMPLGNISDTVLTSIIGHPETDISFTMKTVDLNDEITDFIFDTKLIKRELEGIPLNHPDITSFISSFLTEGITGLYKEEV